MRINQAEINLAVQNDIPRITDTVGTATQKMANVKTMLDNAEKPLATHDWRKKGPAAIKAADAKLSDAEAYKKYQALVGGKK